MSKTVVQHAIAHIDSKQCNEPDENISHGYFEAIAILESLLPVEKEQIVNAKNDKLYPIETGGERYYADYYTTTYPSAAPVTDINVGEIEQSDEVYVRVNYKDALCMTKYADGKNQYCIKIPPYQDSNVISEYMEISQAAWSDAADRIRNKNK